MKHFTFAKPITFSHQPVKVGLINLQFLAMFRKILLFALACVLGLSSLTSFGQSACECASNSSLYYEQEFEKLFPPAVIKSKGIRSVQVTMGGAASYTEMELYFDTSGYVNAQIFYYQGKQNRMNEFLRFNKSRSVAQKKHGYFSGEGMAITYEKIVAYYYDEEGRLWKEKELGLDEMPKKDSESTYTLYVYDDHGRLVEEKGQLHYGSGANFLAPSPRARKWYFAADGRSATYKTWHDGKLFLTGKETYNAAGQMLTITYFNELLNQESGSESFTYDAQGRLLSHEAVSGEGSLSECPDFGNYKNVYAYTPDGLLQSITHTYKGVACIMTVSY